MPHVAFSDGVPYHRVQEYYDRARVFVSTSEAEGFPNSFIQAAMGGAAILSLEVDPDGVLAQFGGGMVADCEADLMSKAEALAEQPETVAAMGRRAPLFVETLLDNAKNVDAFLAGLDGENSGIGAQGAEDPGEDIARPG
jgi:glycosyltransferase involved in cell wall biosynthesis